GPCPAVRDAPGLAAQPQPPAPFRLPLRGLKDAKVTMAQAPPHAPAVRVSPVRHEQLLEIGPAPCGSGKDVGGLILQSTSARSYPTLRPASSPIVPAPRRISSTFSGSSPARSDSAIQPSYSRRANTPVRTEYR